MVPMVPVIVMMMMMMVSPCGWRRRRGGGLKIDANRRSPRFVRTTERQSLLREKKRSHAKSVEMSVPYRSS